MKLSQPLHDHTVIDMFIVLFYLCLFLLVFRFGERLESDQLENFQNYQVEVF